MPSLAIFASSARLTIVETVDSLGFSSRSERGWCQYETSGGDGGLGGHACAGAGGGGGSTGDGKWWGR
ncbi:hypothetical protein ACFXTH_003289 [Malus domestica]